MWFYRFVFRCSNKPDHRYRLSYNYKVIQVCTNASLKPKSTKIYHLNKSWVLLIIRSAHRLYTKQQQSNHCPLISVWEQINALNLTTPDNTPEMSALFHSAYCSHHGLVTDWVQCSTRLLMPAGEKNIFKNLSPGMIQDEPGTLTLKVQGIRLTRDVLFYHGRNRVEKKKSLKETWLQKSSETTWKV